MLKTLTPHHIMDHVWHNRAFRHWRNFKKLGCHSARLAEVEEWCDHADGQVLVVTAPAGLGKSWLFRKLAQQLNSRMNVLKVQGLEQPETRDILWDIANQLGIDGLETNSSRDIRQAVQAHLLEQPALAREVLLLVDDADIVDLEGVEELCALATTGRLRLILFGHPRLANTVGHLARIQDLKWRELQLTKYVLNPKRAYAGWQYQQTHELQDDNVGSTAARRWWRLDMASLRLQSFFWLVPFLALLAWALLPVGDGELAVPAVTDIVEAQDPPIAEQMTPRVTKVASVVEPEPEVMLAPRTTESPDVVRSIEPPVANAVAAAIQDRVIADRVGGARKRDTKWVLELPPDHYTIQLLTAFSASAVNDYLRRQSSASQFGTYELVRNGQTLHAIYYGLYDSYEAAQLGLAQLPGSVGAVKPMVRSIRQLQRNIRSGMAALD